MRVWLDESVLMTWPWGRSAFSQLSRDQSFHKANWEVGGGEVCCTLGQVVFHFIFISDLLMTDLSS